MFDTNFIGRVAKEPQVYNTQDNKQFVSFTAAMNDKVGNEEKTTWVRITSNKSQHITLAKHIKKGTLAKFTGTLTANNSEYEGRTTLEYTLRMEKLEFINTGKKNEEQST